MEIVENDMGKPVKKKKQNKNQKRPFSLYILDRKEYILEQKKEVSKKPKKSKFSKGVSPWFL